MTIRATLLARGYFPKELPPTFYTDAFAGFASTRKGRGLIAAYSPSDVMECVDYRLAMVLHTDQDHPHVHLVVKAASEDGKQLNIRKATLRAWRRQFAAHLRALGITANATERAVRGQIRGPIRDGIYRAMLRGRSTHHQARIDRIVQAVRSGQAAPDPGAAKLRDTRRAVVQGWHAVADQLLNEGHSQLAQQVWKLIGGMPAPQTEDERLRSRLAPAVDTRRHQVLGGRSR